MIRFTHDLFNNLINRRNIICIIIPEEFQQVPGRRRVRNLKPFSRMLSLLIQLKLGRDFCFSPGVVSTNLPEEGKDGRWPLRLIDKLLMKNISLWAPTITK